MRLDLTFDSFGRVSEEQWQQDSTSSGPMQEDTAYGYDSVGNLIYAQNLISPMSQYSELYELAGVRADAGYNGLGYLTNFQRGPLIVDEYPTIAPPIDASTRVYSRDSQGNITSIGTYNEYNGIIGSTDPSGSGDTTKGRPKGSGVIALTFAMLGRSLLIHATSPASGSRRVGVSRAQPRQRP